jgi:hypothetical protein
LALAGFLIYPQTRARFELHYQETEFNKEIIESCPNIKKVKIILLYNRRAIFSLPYI